MATPRSNAFPRTGGAWKLEENATIRLPRSGAAMVVGVERGTVLLTQENDRDDHVLEPGDEVVFDGDGLVVAWAFTEAVISVRDAALGASTVRTSVGDDRSPAPGMRGAA